MQSQSVKYREEGNKLYTSCDMSIPPVIFSSRLEKAINFYKSASDTAVTFDERSSALKNIGKAYYKMILKEQKEDLIISHLLNSLEALIKALHFGEKGKPKEWQENLNEEIILIADETLVAMQGLPDFSTRHKNVYKLKNLFSSTKLHCIQSKNLRSLVRGNLTWALSLFKQKDYKQVLKILYDSMQYIEEGLFIAKQFTKTNFILAHELIEEFEEKKEAYTFLLSRTEALIQLTRAEDILYKALMRSLY